VTGHSCTGSIAAKALGITQARLSDINRGKFGQFSLDVLVRLASRAGLKPRLKLAA
jgi:predicted XRE-type DNA-binding protein